MPKKEANDGEYVHYHKDGSIWAKGTKVNGQMDGYWEWFRKDGTKMRSGYLEKDKQVGKWTSYDKDGREVKVTVFKSPT